MSISNRFESRFFLSLSALVTLCVLGWVLAFCRYGIDFTDEGYYLVWMSNPFDYNVTITQFGYIYNPLFKFLGGSITALRQANIIINFILATMVSWVFLKSVFITETFEFVDRVVISGAIGIVSVSSLVLDGSWLPSLSYNSLALQGLMFAVFGLIISNNQLRHWPVVGHIIVGFGTWLAFMGKPSTGVAFGLCTIGYMFWAKKFSIRLFFYSSFTAFLLFIFSALIIDSSIIRFIERLFGGMEAFKILKTPHSIASLIRIDGLNIPEEGIFVFAIFFVLTYCGVYFSQVENKVPAYFRNILAVAFALLSLLAIFGLERDFLYYGRFQGLLFGAVVLASFLSNISLYGLNVFKKNSRSNLVLAVLLLLLPFVYACGTGNNYWSSAAVASVFWVLAGYVFCRPIRPIRHLSILLLFLGFAGQLATIVIVHGGLRHPYRQPQPLDQNDCDLVTDRPGSGLILSKDYCRYVQDAHRLAKQSGFKQGTPIIDLTGQSPGLLYLIGARNIGWPWLIGGYPGSESLAASMLRKASCQSLAESWLLVEKGGPRVISEDILGTFGARMTDDFEIVGTVWTAEGAGGYKERRPQQLLKPIRQAGKAIVSCYEARKINHF